MDFQSRVPGRHMSIYMNHVHSNASTEHSVLAPDVISFPKRKAAKAHKGSVTTTITTHTACSEGRDVRHKQVT